MAYLPVWERIRKGIVAKVNSGSPITKAIFNGAMFVPVLVQLADSFVPSNVRAAGVRLIAFSGSAAISRGTQEFLTTALATVIQGSPFICV